MTSSTGRRGPRRGFTLLELLTVLTIVALVAAVVPWIIGGWGGGTQLTAAVSDVRSDIRLVRSQARLTGRVVTLAVIDGGKGYEVEPGDLERHLPSGLTVEILPADRIGGTEPGVVRLFPNGGSSGGRVVIVSQDRKTVLAIDGLTGRVELAS